MGLVSPTRILPKLRLEGNTLTVGAEADTPVPVSGIVCGLLGALSTMVTAPVRVRVVVGLKFTLMVQLAPGKTVVPHVPRPAKAKSPLIVKVLGKVRFAPPVLVRVTNCVVLVVPTV
jgi:hypothetical protein